MAGETEHRDPADIARERNVEVAGLLRRAEMIEEQATAIENPTKLEDVAVMNSLFAGANNLRLQALCLHLRLPTLEVNDGKDEA